MAEIIKVVIDNSTYILTESLKRHKTKTSGAVSEYTSE